MYADSTSQIFKLMVEEKKEELRRRMFEAREKVFGWGLAEPVTPGVNQDKDGGIGGGKSNPGMDPSSSTSSRHPVLLSDSILDEFSLGQKNAPGEEKRRNSQLSLLAMVDSWARLGIKPYEHLDVAATPVFVLWFGEYSVFIQLRYSQIDKRSLRYFAGVAEWLFRSPQRLEAAIEAAIHDKTHRSEDTEFIVAARGWSQCVSFGNFDLYKMRFEEAAKFFAPRFEEATKVGGQMIKTILQESAKQKQKGV